MADFLPRADLAFDTWMRTFMGAAEAQAEEMGFTPEDFAAVAAAKAEWEESLRAHAEAQATAAAKCRAKDDSRADLTRKLRPLVGRIQASPLVSDANRIAMGLQKRDVGHHTPAGVPSDAPLGYVAQNMAYAHVIKFMNRDDAGARIARPPGCTGCEVWFSFDGPTQDVTKLRFAGTATRTPYTVRHSEEDVGKTAHYVLRWVNTRCEPGPWSAPFRAMIMD